MNWVARVLCALLGFVTLGPVGAIIGLIVGYYFDRALTNFQSHFDPAKRQQVEQILFASVFQLIGHMAKSDGRVSEDEIAVTETMMKRMRLSEEQRLQAIEWFKHGARPDFDVDMALTEFINVCGPYPDIKQLMLVYLITMALSDGAFHAEEEKILRRVGLRLGYSEAAFEHVLRMAKAQDYFHRDEHGNPAGASVDSLQKAYDALGVDASVTDPELKRAYRKLMSQYHPDKLAGQGVPEEMIKVATERSQEIQAAYDLIKRQRA